MTTITLPFTERQAQACAAAALVFGVESWEMGVHILAERQRSDLLRRIASVHVQSSRDGES